MLVAFVWTEPSKTNKTYLRKNIVSTHVELYAMGILYFNLSITSFCHVSLQEQAVIHTFGLHESSSGIVTCFHIDNLISHQP